jgi:cytoskeletal protein RodZ
MQQDFENRTPTSEDIRRWAGSFRLAGWVFLGLALLLTWGIYRQFSTAQNSKNWPFVTGEVTEFDIRNRPADNSVYARIRYIYKVDGNTYTGTRFTLDNGESGIRQVARRLDAYPQGHTITVYFNPNNPSHAVLEPGMPVNSLMVTAMAYLFFVLVVVILSAISFRFSSHWQEKLELKLEEGPREAAHPMQSRPARTRAINSFSS